MTEILLIILIVLVAATLVIVLTRKSAAPIIPDNTQGLQLLQNQLQDLARAVDSKLSDSNKMMQIQHGQSSRIIADVTERLTKLDETNRQVVGFADQLKHLQDILKNPKQRGVLGEFYLETVMKNVLPPGSYQMQYEFADKTKVDAVIFIGEQIIPIDAKFTLENYNRILSATTDSEREDYEKAFRQDLKTRIDETSKYIKPKENTMDFAFMFIPAEGVYYDLLINKVGSVQISSKDLIEYAFSKKVIVVSPTSFLAYLQTVLQGLRGMQIQNEAKDIIKRVEELGKHLANYEQYMVKLGTQMGTTVGTYNTAYKELRKIDKDVVKITGEKRELEEILVIDKPRGEDE